MKIRTIYFKVSDMQKAVSFWQGFLQIQPHKTFPRWYEFMIGELRLGLLLTENFKKSSSNCIPVFEFKDEDLPEYIEKAKLLGAEVVIDGLDDPNMLSICFRDPLGNEFELSKFHE